jgi:hypothetical protein
MRVTTLCQLANVGIMGAVFQDRRLGDPLLEWNALPAASAQARAEASCPLSSQPAAPGGLQQPGRSGLLPE